TISNLANADDAINNGVTVGSGTAAGINYANPPANNGNHPEDVNPFGLSAGNEDHFVVRSLGYLRVREAGNYQFRNRTDDGSRLRLDLNRNGQFEVDENIILDNVLS